MAQLLNEFAFHDGHIRQVLELYRSHVLYPEMGAYQRITRSTGVHTCVNTWSSYLSGQF
jgi:hypothetical protein